MRRPPLERFLTVFDHRRQEYAGYVEQEARLFDGHLIATGGFRVDGYSDFGKEVSPAWSVAMPLERTERRCAAITLRVFARPASTNSISRVSAIRNLGPEISSEYDGGFTKDLGETASFTATYFSRRVHRPDRSRALRIQGPGCPFGATAGNAGRVDTQGVEFVPMWRPLEGLGPAAADDPRRSA